MYYYFGVKQLLYGNPKEVIEFCIFMKKLNAQNKGQLRELEYSVNQNIRIIGVLDFVNRSLL
jgi:hypothetical protein